MGLFAQTSTLPIVKEIVSIENENTGETMEIVNIPIDGVNRYFLHVGNMGIGDKVVQINLDPVYRLYIPLGNNITDAVAYMEDLKTLFKSLFIERRSLGLEASLCSMVSHTMEELITSV